MKRHALLVVLGTLAPLSHAETWTFVQVDTNDDGVLSTSEAEMALPDVMVVDSNNDGMFNPAEAEAAVPGLTLSLDGEDKTSAFVGPSEYDAIIEAITMLESGEEAGDKS